MGRWEPNAEERLQGAAIELFTERWYADVTVAEIADRAGLTKRTFFNHFAALMRRSLSDLRHAIGAAQPGGTTA